MQPGESANHSNPMPTAAWRAPVGDDEESWGDFRREDAAFRFSLPQREPRGTGGKGVADLPADSSFCPASAPSVAGM
ncbi:hypothetical protein LDC_0643 [sediment metagenome]|uniref:Uncharacterized protein n=1 Tax=sediment metagenome TaxID=749907 RepID=D9PGJ6_9ZZZZ